MRNSKIPGEIEFIGIEMQICKDFAPLRCRKYEAHILFGGDPEF